MPTRSSRSGTSTSRDANFVVPPAIIGDEALEGAWHTQIESAQRTYVALVEQLMERYGWVADKVHRRKMAREAARGVLPNSTETKIVVTGNARAWRTMLELRSSEGAELEIRRLRGDDASLLTEETPAFFSDFEIYEATDRREAARSATTKSDRVEKSRLREKKADVSSARNNVLRHVCRRFIYSSP